MIGVKAPSGALVTFCDKALVSERKTTKIALIIMMFKLKIQVDPVFLHSSDSVTSKDTLSGGRKKGCQNKVCRQHSGLHQREAGTSPGETSCERILLGTQSLELRVCYS